MVLHSTWDSLYFENELQQIMHNYSLLVEIEAAFLEKLAKQTRHLPITRTVFLPCLWVLKIWDRSCKSHTAKLHENWATLLKTHRQRWHRLHISTFWLWVIPLPGFCLLESHLQFSVLCHRNMECITLELNRVSYMVRPATSREERHKDL